MDTLMFTPIAQMVDTCAKARRRDQALDGQAHALLDQEPLEIDTFERYRLWRNKAQAKYQEAA